jgi:hypothetical protein
MSGDDRKGRFDWLSQIGFRDPATGFSARPQSRDVDQITNVRSLS